MKVEGEISVPAPRALVFGCLSDAQFFTSCIDSVRELTSLDAQGDAPGCRRKNSRRCRSRRQDGGFSNVAVSFSLIYILGFMLVPFLAETKGQPLPA